jgi:hypothetical protein
MSAITKDLKYYLANPDKMPTDPKVLEELANEQVRNILGENEKDLTIDRYVTTDPVNKDERTGASSDAEAQAVEEAKKAAEAAEAAKAAEEAKVKEEADAAAKAVTDAEALKKVEEAEAAEAAKAETKPEGVLAKDGKHVIPYAALTSARERAEAAERLAQQQAQEIEQLKAEKAGNTTAQAKEAEVLSDAELEALAEDSPTLAKILKAQQARIAQLNVQVKDVINQTAQHDTDAKVAAQNTVQEAIDANPTLSAWQVAEDQSKWEEAARIDKALRESPLWRGKTFEERFKKVVELTQSVFGEETKPVVEKTPVAQDVKVDKKPTLTEAEIRAAAEAKLAAKSKAAVPVSLSQIPGGTPPVVDERERVEQMSASELGSKLLNMSKEQQAEYLASL